MTTAIVIVVISISISSNNQQPVAIVTCDSVITLGPVCLYSSRVGVNASPTVNKRVKVIVLE